AFDLLVGADGGEHVNGILDPAGEVWVVHVAAPPNPASIEVPAGQKAPVYTHFTVVLDVASHHWIEEAYEK
ncbi:hypothetical protein ACFQ1S_23585, partial [Kibdelosporangium lantanae]